MEFFAYRSSKSEPQRVGILLYSQIGETGADVKLFQVSATTPS